MEKIFQQKDEKLFELNNELLYYKNIYGVNNNITGTSFEDLNTSNSLLKKKKIDDYVFIYYITADLIFFILVRVSFKKRSNVHQIKRN